MTAVYGAAQTLLRQDIELGPQQKQALLTMIATQAAELSQITEEVLLTSRLDRGELIVERERVDVAEAVHAAVHAMRPQLPDSMTIEVEIGEDVDAASGDSRRIQQVLTLLGDGGRRIDGS